MAVRCQRFGALPAGIALLISSGLLGCASARTSPTVVRVGGASIDRRSVEHWTAVIAHGAIVANVADSWWSPRRQTLALLIYSHWLLGEASRLGLTPSSRGLEQTIAAQERSMPGGRAEFEELLEESGETRADVEFEARARWAASALAGHIEAAVDRRAKAQAPPAAIARFYRAHAKRYRLRERRYYDLIERIPSRAEAAALAKRIGTGRRFAEKASKERPFRPVTFAGLPGQGVVYRAVFKAKVGVLTGPLPLQQGWALFVIRRIELPRVQPLSEVRGMIERQLLGPAARRARTQIIEDFHRRSKSKTDCRAGYVVEKCRQYAGPAGPEHDPLADF